MVSHKLLSIPHILLQIFKTKLTKDDKNFKIIYEVVDVMPRILDKSPTSLLLDALPILRILPTAFKKDCDWFENIFVKQALTDLIRQHKVLMQNIV